MNLDTLAVHGVLSTADARAMGLGASELRALVRTGRLWRLIRGWYAVSPPGAATPPWVGTDPFDTARRLHRLRTSALVRSFAGRVVASHQSALVLHDVDLWRADLDTIHLTRTTDDHSRHRVGAVIHPASGGRVVEMPGGLATTDVATAVVAVGLRPEAGSASATPMESLIAADSALRLGLTSPAELAAVVDENMGHPGIRAVRRLLDWADGRHESVGETRLAFAMRTLGYRFTPQVEYVVDGRSYRGDFELDDAPVIVEFDGMAKYGGGVATPTPEQVRAALAAEKRREDALRSHGRLMVRFVWAELTSLQLIQRRIDRAIDLARLLRSA